MRVEYRHVGRELKKTRRRQKARRQEKVRRRYAAQTPLFATPPVAARHSGMQKSSVVLKGDAMPQRRAEVAAEGNGAEAEPQTRPSKTATPVGDAWGMLRSRPSAWHVSAAASRFIDENMGTEESSRVQKEQMWSRHAPAQRAL
jgi:hypothetical protein